MERHSRDLCFSSVEDLRRHPLSRNGTRPLCEGVQFVMNALLTEDGSSVQLPYGVQDCESAILTLPIDFVDSELLELRVVEPR